MSFLIPADCSSNIPPARRRRPTKWRAIFSSRAPNCATAAAGSACGTSAERKSTDPRSPPPERRPKPHPRRKAPSRRMRKPWNLVVRDKARASPRHEGAWNKSHPKGKRSCERGRKERAASWPRPETLTSRPCGRARPRYSFHRSSGTRHRFCTTQFRVPMQCRRRRRLCKIYDRTSITTPEQDKCTTLTRPKRALEQATLARGDSSQARRDIGIARRAVIMRSDESRLRFVESYFLRSQAIEGIGNGSGRRLF